MEPDDSPSPDTTGRADETDSGDDGGPDPAMTTAEEGESAQNIGGKTWRRGRNGRWREEGERRAYLPRSPSQSFLLLRALYIFLLAS
jgi:hypothetical protein